MGEAIWDMSTQLVDREKEKERRTWDPVFPEAQAITQAGSLQGVLVGLVYSKQEGVP